MTQNDRLRKLAKDFHAAEDATLARCRRCTEEHLLSEWKSTTSFLSKQRRGTSAYAATLGVREATKKLLLAKGVKDPDERLAFRRALQSVHLKRKAPVLPRNRKVSHGSRAA